MFLAGGCCTDSAHAEKSVTDSLVTIQRTQYGLGHVQLYRETICQGEAELPLKEAAQSSWVSLGQKGFFGMMRLHGTARCASSCVLPDSVAKFVDECLKNVCFTPMHPPLDGDGASDQP